jgi:NTE family protein
MERLNSILLAGTSAFGSAFDDMLSRELTKLRGAPLRYLRAVHVRPSADIGEIASHFVQRGKIDVRGRVARRVLAALAGGEARNESDLLSYLLFDGSFCARLIEMGYADAEARATEIAELFSRDVQTEPVSGSS